jgi:hydroxymethylpyrimidine/phosphomethylpyrimidine kinase
MLIETNRRPVILVMGGHDPGGGAGVQADIETIGVIGCHAASALTCLTVQDSCNVYQIIPLSAQTLKAQALAVLKDCSVSAIKIGLLGSVEVAKEVAALLSTYPNIPVVFDPVLAAGGGSDLANESILRVIREQLLPLSLLITPNTHEALRLTGAGQNTSAEACVEILHGLGSGSVLLTGTHDLSHQDEVLNRFYRSGLATQISQWPRLPGEYHGSGCTLSSAIAARIGLGDSLESAVQYGLSFCWSTLKYGFRTGRCQSLPNRFYQNTHNQTDLP